VVHFKSFIRGGSAQSFGNMNLLPHAAMLLAAITSLGAGTQFPSAASNKSPDGRWRVRVPKTTPVTRSYLSEVEEQPLNFDTLAVLVIPCGPLTRRTWPLQTG
jgi:hypothetical protein